jgi:dienelactone hydrolase
VSAIRRLLSLVVSLGLLGAAARAEEPRTPITLADLYSDEDTRDAAISPSGRYLAIASTQAGNDVVVVQDVDAGTRTIPISIERSGAGKDLDTRISHVYWKNDDRLLFRVQVRPRKGVDVAKYLTRRGTSLGDRLFAINRDGSKSTRLLAGGAGGFLAAGALDLGAIGSLLPRDPDHILMVVNGWVGATLMRVDINDGTGTIVEVGGADVIGWWPDVDGNPVIRVLKNFGKYRFERKQDDGWQQFHEVPVKEFRDQPDYEPIGPTSEPGKYYVIARPPGRERTGVYLYDIGHATFGEPVAENPLYDIYSAQVARDGKGILWHCYVVHVRVCDLADARANSHMKGLRRYFQDGANVHVTDVSLDSNTLVLFVEGPTEPPAYYYYRVPAKHIEFIGLQRHSLFNKIAPIATPVSWKARDGREITGYLTRPAGSADARALPLVVLPHGGPEVRDRLRFDPWTQFLAARGYAVFQPNFRGSDGYGRAFAESGYGEWGRAMQDDISDGVESLIQQGIADPARVCIMGASYGGYAALAGAALTPDRYRCAVSIAGVSDLSAFVRWYKFEYGKQSEGASYWMRAIGDPERVRDRLRAVSPVHLADQIKADVLLIHGTEDKVVPYSQSKAMKRALDSSSRKIRLIELEGEGHSYWSPEDEKLALDAIGAFLAKNLGPGFTAKPNTETSHAN